MYVNFSELIYPSCPLCRQLRISMCAGLVLMLVTYAVQLARMKES